MISLIYSIISLALQGPEGPPPPGPDYGEDGQQLPINEDISLLIVLGLIVGIYWIYRRNRPIDKAS